METAYIPKWPYFNCFIVPIQCIYVRSFISSLVEFFFMTVWISNVPLLCQDYAMVRRLPLNNFCRNLVKTLSSMASRRNKYSLHNYAYRYFVLITDSHVHTSCCVKWLFHCFEFPVVRFHLRSEALRMCNCTFSVRLFRPAVHGTWSRSLICAFVWASSLNAIMDPSTLPDMCLRCFIHTNCTSVGKPRPSFA